MYEIRYHECVGLHEFISTFDEKMNIEWVTNYVFSHCDSAPQTMPTANTLMVSLWLFSQR